MATATVLTRIMELPGLCAAEDRVWLDEVVRPLFERGRRGGSEGAPAACGAEVGAVWIYVGRAAVHVPVGHAFRRVSLTRFGWLSHSMVAGVL